jgi:DNA-binding winged helix-turn-helix (wHTH) protein
MRTFSFDRFELVERTRCLYYGAHAVSMTSQECDVLLLLVRAAGSLVTKDAIASAISPDGTCSDSSVAQIAYRLRRELARHAPDTFFIATISGKGYQFVAQVSESPERPARAGRDQL